MKKKKSLIKPLLLAGVVSAGSITGYNYLNNYLNQVEILKKVVQRLEADSRVAEVLVTGVNYDEATQQMRTRIKFLEYGVDDKPLKPRYFEFAGNIIQFQALVMRFDDVHIRNADLLKGKSAYLFLKVFLLDGKNTQEYELTRVNSIPQGYKLEGISDEYEKTIWEDFWTHALDPKRDPKLGIKNAQIEAPGTMFVPGILYTIRIEHDGGLRIDTAPLSPILQGETIPKG